MMTVCVCVFVCLCVCVCVPGDKNTVQVHVTLSGPIARHVVVCFQDGGESGEGGGLLCLTRELDMGVVQPGAAEVSRLVYVEAVRAGLARLPLCMVHDRISGDAFSVALPSVTTIVP